MSLTLRNLGIAALLAVSASAFIPSQASAMSMADCSAKFKAAKAAGTDGGMKWNDFRKAQCAADAAAAPAATAAPAAAKAPAAAVAAAPAAPDASGPTLKECSVAWKAVKAAGTVPAGMKWKEFVAAKCQVPGAAAAPVAPAPKMAAPVAPAAKMAAPVAPVVPAAPAAAATKMAAPAAKMAAPAATAAAPAAGEVLDKNGKPMTPGRAAMVTRERACGVKWKAAKAAGTLPAGQTWPQFWSACNTELKAAGQ